MVKWVPQWWFEMIKWNRMWNPSDVTIFLVMWGLGIKRGAHGCDLLLKKLKESCKEVKHLILEGNQFKCSQQIEYAQQITRANLPCLTSLTLCYDNYSTFLSEILAKQKLDLLYLRVSDAIIDQDDAIALQNYLSRKDCPLQRLVLESKGLMAL